MTEQPSLAAHLHVDICSESHASNDGSNKVEEGLARYLYIQSSAIKLRRN